MDNTPPKDPPESLDHQPYRVWIKRMIIVLIVVCAIIGFLIYSQLEERAQRLEKIDMINEQIDNGESETLIDEAGGFDLDGLSGE